jgi:hypothetical protein
MTIQTDRRQFLLLSASALAAGAAGPAPARARQATASPDLPVATATDDGIDVPVLEIAFSADGLAVTPDEIPAGTVRVVTSSDGTDDQGTFTFRVPDDQDVDAVLALARALDAQPPDWFFDALFPGGVRNGSHVPTVAEGFMVLDPGTYIVADSFTSSAAAVVATGESGVPVDIPADIHVVAEDSMTYTGLEEPVPAGRQLWRLDNGGELFHSIYIYSTPEGATADDILAIFEGLFSGATPEGGEDPFEGYGEGVMSTSMLSPALTNWFYLDLEPGPYAAMCTSSDSFEAPPHFIMGMIVTFTVA